MRIFFVIFSAYYLLSVIAVPLPPCQCQSGEISTRVTGDSLSISPPTGTRSPDSEGLYPRASRNTRRRQKARQKKKKKVAQKKFPIGSVVWGAPAHTINQPLHTNLDGIIPEANRRHPMIVVDHAKSGNLHIVPVSNNPPDPRVHVNSHAYSAGLDGMAYVGPAVYINPVRVYKDDRYRMANMGDVHNLKEEVESNTRH